MSPRLCVVAFYLLLGAHVAHASPCASLKSHPEAWVSTKVDALVLAARAEYEDDEAPNGYKRTLGEIAGMLRRCELSKDEEFVSAYRELVEYVEAASLDQLPGHELGFNVSDKQYFAETSEYVQIPDFLTSRSFLRLVSRHETLEQAKTILRSLNSTREPYDKLIFFSYKSRHLGTPDNNDSFERLLIVVPGSAEARLPEKWVQFGVTDPGKRARVRNVSVVSTIAEANGTSNVYFKDYFRTYRRDGSITINGRWELGFGDDNCVRCHKSGVLPIFPVAGSVSSGELQAVQAVNRRFMSYGPPRFDKYLDASKFGPGLGFANGESRARRFGATFKESVVARAMTCSACHRSEGLGSLSWPMDKTLISSYVKGGPMPLGSTLKPFERAELYNKLIQEYFATDSARPGILKSWLLGKLR
jgi:hypothetical protein